MYSKIFESPFLFLNNDSLPFNNTMGDNEVLQHKNMYQIQ